MSLVAVADAGTTNLKAGVVDPQGELLSVERRAIPLHTPEEGAAEHDPEELFRLFTECMRSATDGYASRIGAVALSGYQFGFVPLDGEYRPLTGIITLMDTRPQGAAERVASRLGREWIYQRTGCPPVFTSLLSKVEWMRSAKPGLLQRTRRFADVKAYLIRRLTGRFATEPSLAASTQLLNCRRRRWDEELLDAANLEAEQLPEVVEGSEVLADISPGAAEALGLPTGVKLVPGVYDGGALFPGMGALSDETGVCNLGTSAMLRACVDRAVLDDPSKARIQSYPLLPGRWAAGGGVNNAGSTLRWLKDNLGGGRDYAELIEEAAQVEPGCDGLTCLPYLTGERDPRIGAGASGQFVGIRQRHELGHLTRAVLEGVAFTLAMLQDALGDEGVRPGKLKIAGSGSRSDLWPRIIADVLDVPVQMSATEEVSLTGEALLGQTALGTYATLEEACRHMVKAGTSFEPRPDNVETYRNVRGRFANVLRTTRGLYSGGSR